MSIKEKLLHPLHSFFFILLIFLAILFVMVIIIEKKGIPNHIAANEHSREESLKEPGPRKPPSTGTEKSPKICKSQECITLADQLINWRDTRVDPCENFYKYACGNYIQHSLSASRFYHKMMIIFELLREFLRKNQPSDSPVENVVRVYYQQCKSLKSHFDEDQKLGYKNVIEDIQKIGKWPMLDEDWDESTFDLNATLINMAKLYSHDFGFFRFNVFGYKTLVISGTTGIKFLNHRFKKKVKDVLKTKNSKLNKTNLEQDFNEVQGLIARLNLIQGNGTEGKTFLNLKELERLVPIIDFRKIIDAFAPNTAEGKLIADGVRNIAFVEISQIFKNNTLEKILKSTPKHVVANFLILTYIHNTLFLLVPRNLSDIKEVDCARKTIDALPNAAVIIFARYYFEKQNLKLVSSLVEDLRMSFVEYLNESTWLHEETKKNAILKVMKIRKMIGYPERYDVPGAVDKMFESIDINFGDSFYSIQRKVLRSKTEQYMANLNSNEFITQDYQLFLVNAFYAPLGNALAITVPLIDDPFFDETWPNYAKIASIGFLLGHEMGHSFGPFPMRLNEDGQRRNWWNPDDMTRYMKKIHCLVEQYNHYDDPNYETNLNGSITVSEMIADTHGVTVSWRLFKKTNYSHAPKLPGFENYSTERLFFQSYALNHCSFSNEEIIRVGATNPHPIESFRVNGVLSNLKAFAEVFDCREGTPMNPKDKCELF